MCEAVSCVGGAWPALVEFTEEQGFVRAMGDDMRIFGMVIRVNDEGRGGGGGGKVFV